MAVLAAAVASCAAPPKRSAVLDELNAEPMSGRVWSQVTGTYTGCIRASTERGSC